MTSPWSYTGKAAPQAKPMASSAAPQRPARAYLHLTELDTCTSYIPVRMWPARPCVACAASPTLSTTALAAPAVPAVAPTAIATAAITATSVASGLFRRQRDLVR